MHRGLLVGEGVGRIHGVDDHRHVGLEQQQPSVAGLGAACPRIDRAAFDPELSGSLDWFEDYRAGERIDHVDGVTVEEAEHQTATRLYQNAAKVHFNQFSEGQGRFGRRLIYGGHVISLARALSFNGLANAFHIAAINGGRHVAPLFAGGTVFAWSQVLVRAELPGRTDVGAMRLVREQLPHIHIHTSVGCGITNYEYVKFLREMGASYVVLPYRLSVDEIALIKGEAHAFAIAFLLGGPGEFHQSVAREVVMLLSPAVRVADQARVRR